MLLAQLFKAVNDGSNLLPFQTGKFQKAVKIKTFQIIVLGNNAGNKTDEPF